MKLSFIIPAYNEEKYLTECVKAIHIAIEWFVCRAYHDYEIIIIDNNSTDDTSIYNRLGCRTYFTDAKNIAGVRNAGAKLNSGGQYLIFVDADTQISPFLVDEIINGGALYGGSLLKLDKPSFIGNLITSIWNKICIRKNWYTGCFMFVERNLFNSVGGFNEDLFLLEDIDLSQRLNKAAPGKGLLIRNAPVVTSARKLTLYKWHEHLRFWFTLLFRFKQTLTTRKLCFMWYDGRR